MMDTWGGYGAAYGNPWGSLFSFIFMALFMVALVVGVLYMLRHTDRHHQHGESTQTSALDLLNQRYAKGEITQEEYKTIKKDLA